LCLPGRRLASSVDDAPFRQIPSTPSCQPSETLSFERTQPVHRRFATEIRTEATGEGLSLVGRGSSLDQIACDGQLAPQEGLSQTRSVRPQTSAEGGHQRECPCILGWDLSQHARQGNRTGVTVFFRARALLLRGYGFNSYGLGCSRLRHHCLFAPAGCATIHCW